MKWKKMERKVKALLLEGCMCRSASVHLWCLGAMSLQPLAGHP